MIKEKVYKVTQIGSEEREWILTHKENLEPEIEEKNISKFICMDGEKLELDEVFIFPIRSNDENE